MLHILAALGVICLLLFTASLLRIVPGDASLTISERAASKNWLYILFGSMLSIFGSLFWAYLFFSLGPRLDAPVLFYVGVIGGWIAMLLTAWIRARLGTNNMHGPHYRAAMAMGWLMMITMASLPFAVHASAVVRSICGITALWYVYTVYLAVFESKGYKRKYFLLFEIINVVSFMVILIAI